MLRNCYRGILQKVWIFSAPPVTPPPPPPLHMFKKCGFCPDPPPP